MSDNQAESDAVLALAKSLYLGSDPWESLASSFRASLLVEAEERLSRPATCNIPCDADCDADCHAGHYITRLKPHPDGACQQPSRPGTEGGGDRG